VILSRVE